MAYSTQSAVSNGTLVSLGITIEYFDRTEISVLFNDVLVAKGSGWDWVGTTDPTLSFTPAVPNLTKVTVVRATDISEIRHDLAGGAAYTDQTMDENFKQVLHIAQEAREGLQLGDIYQNLNMHGFRMLNIAAPVAPSDAMSYGAYQADVSGNFAAAVAVATASASASAVTATAQKDAAVVAKVAAEAAQAAAAAAAASIVLPLAVASGGTGSTTAADARTALGLANTPITAALQAEMVAGAEAGLRSMSPLNVAQAIAALNRVVQVVEATPITAVVTCATSVPYDDTIPQNTEGNEVITAAITPSSATSRIRVEFECQCTPAAAAQIIVGLFVDTTADALAAHTVYNSTTGSTLISLSYEAAAGSTSARTYKVRVGGNVATVYINANETGVRKLGGASAARMRVTEIRA